MKNIDLFYELIMRHLETLECLYLYTEKMIHTIDAGEVNRIEAMTSNRQRLINLVNDLQTSIDQQATKLASLKSPELSLVAQSWLNDSEQIVQKIDRKHFELIETMNNQKSKIQKQVGASYQSRQSLSKYRPSNVK